MHIGKVKDKKILFEKCKPVLPGLLNHSATHYHVQQIACGFPVLHRYIIWDSIPFAAYFRELLILL